MRFYLHEPKNRGLKVFSIMAIVGKDAVPIFIKKYGENKIHVVNNMTIDVWRNDYDVAGISNIDGDAYLCNVQTHG